MIVGARWVGWMILQFADLLRFSSTNISKGLQRIKKNKKPENMQRAAVIWEKMPSYSNTSGQRTMARLLCAVTQISTCSNQGKCIYEHMTLNTETDGLQLQRPRQMPLLSVKSRKLRLQFCMGSQNWTTENWKNIS